MKLSKLFLLLCFLGANAVFAQEKWDLAKCVQYAQDNNLQVRLSNLNIETNKNNLETSKQSRYPNLNGQITNNYNFGLFFDPFTNQATNDRIRSNNFGISSSVTVFNGFKIQNTIKQNQLNLEASKLNVDQQKNDISLSIANAYLQILFNKELVANAERQLENTKNQYDLTKKQVDAGVLPKTNLFDLESQIATNELQIVNQENNLALSYLQLEQFMQLPNDDKFEIVVPEIPEPSENLTLESVEEIYNTALGNQPNIRSGQLNIEAAELQKKIAKADYYPSISLGGNISTRYATSQTRSLLGFEQGEFVRNQEIGFFNNDQGGQTLVYTPVYDRGNPIIEKISVMDQLSDGLNKSFGFTLSIPIYNRNQINSGMESARIFSERSKLNLEVTKNTLRQNIESAYLNVIAAQKSYESTKKQVAALEEQLRVTKQQVLYGAGNSTDANIAENNYFNAQSDLLRAKYDFFFRLKILDFYMGKELKL